MTSSAPPDPGSFTAGARLGDPVGDESREAVAALLGFAYQIYATALAWLALADGEDLYVEVAEDYAVATRKALKGVQVKAVAGKATIRTSGVVATINSLVDLTARNTGRTVSLRYLTTAEIGQERAAAERVDGPTLLYWRRAAAGAEIAPLRRVLLGLPLEQATRDFITARSDDELREDLLKRIHWDCGQPSIGGLDRELEDGLTEFVVATLRLQSDVALLLKGTMLSKLLQLASGMEARRQVRRADLIRLGEQAGMVLVPRAMLLAMPGGSAIAAAGLLLPAATEPGPLPLVERRALLDAALDRLESARALIVSGSTGVGKTTLAQSLAAARSGSWHVCDFRGLAAKEVAARLAIVRGEVLASPARMLLLDDLEHLEDPSVQTEAGRLLEALDRRDGAALITCALSPGPTILARLTGSVDGNIDVPYLTPGEVAELIESTGGPPERAPTVFVATSGGHPQLVQAALLLLRSSGWSEQAWADLAAGGGVAEERAAARRRLISALDAEARCLLHRTSLILGRFDRQLALVLGGVPPPVSHAGDALDRVIGPWIELLDGQELRVSPLVARSGEEALGRGEREAVHRAIADHQLRSGSLSMASSDMVLHHSISGGDPRQVVGFATAVITASEPSLAELGRHAVLLRTLGTDAPAVDQPEAARLLRLAQMLVSIASGSAQEVQSVWVALQRERGADDGEGFEEVILAKMLSLSALSSKLPEWLDLMIRLDELIGTSPRLGPIAADLMEAGARMEVSGLLFAVQVMGLRRISDLRAAFERLARLDAAARERLLSAGAQTGGFSFLTNAVWLKEAAGGTIDGRAAMADYLAMADFSASWGNARLAIRCLVTAAIMLDEYARDPDEALSVLASAEERFGRSTAISRARAKVRWRRKDHAAALQEFASIDLDEIQDRVERAHIAREAGISAADLGRWSEAADWFERGRASALEVEGELLRPMAIGLGADAAQARYEADEPRAAIEGYARALRELRSLTVGSSLTGDYCHYVVRHAVLWLTQQATGTVDLSDVPTLLPAGACSNPEPMEQIRDRPLGQLDMAWYLLAEAELAMGLPSELGDHLRGELEDGPILSCEVSRPMRSIEAAIAAVDGRRAAALLGPLGAAAEVISSRREELLAADTWNPIRGDLPHLVIDGSERAIVRDKLADAVLAFGLRAGLAGRPEAIRALLEGMGDDLRGLRGLGRRLAGGEAATSDHGEELATTIGRIAAGPVVDPSEALAASGRLVLYLARSEFRQLLEEPLARWIRETWQLILQEHRFRLLSPQLTARDIETALTAYRPSLAWCAGLVAAAVPAAHVQLGEGVRARLAQLAAAD